MNTSQIRMPSKHSLQTIKKCYEAISPDDESLDSWSSNYLRNHEARIAIDLDIAERFSQKHSRIVDIATIPLALISGLKSRGKDVIGIDKNPARFSQTLTKLDLNVLKCDIEEEPLPIRDNYADLVIFNEIFEHLRINPIKTLNEIYRITKPGGVLLLSTPNLRSLKGLSNLTFKNRGFALSHDIYSEFDRLRTLGHMGHIREYTTLEVSEFLQKIGFTIKEIIYRGHYSGRAKRIFLRIFPQFRPFFTCVAHKD